MAKPNTLLCTVGMSLFHPNVAGLPASAEQFPAWLTKQPEADRSCLGPEAVSRLGQHYARRAWRPLGQELGELPGGLRLCGAELNSIHHLLRQEIIEPVNLFLFRSATPGGEQVAEVLSAALERQFQQIQIVSVSGLQDDNPRDFRTLGLRNLARELARKLREYRPERCAINATGGYKAQIAIAVLLGQALRVPVFYLFERFPEIIAFPPMPVSLDLDLWAAHAGLFASLSAAKSLEPFAQFEDEWEERLEPLVDRVPLEGAHYVDLSPMGQIFHEAARERFDASGRLALPPAVPSSQKKPPRMEQTGHVGNSPEARAWLERVTAARPYVRRCATTYANPDLPARRSFRVSGDKALGTWSDGTATVRFFVETTASSAGELAAVVIDLNDWLATDG